MVRVRQAILLLPLLFTMGLSGACGSPDMGPAVAIPDLGLNRVRVPLGGPLEMTYRFSVLPEIGSQVEAYRVFVDFLDADGEVMFSDHHDPPVATTNWRPGQTVTYERRMFIPLYPYVGEASIVLRLSSPSTGDPVALVGEHLGQGAYAVATVELAPPPTSFLWHRGGWHRRERDGNREWRWSSGEAVFAFQNPRQDSICISSSRADRPCSSHLSGWHWSWATERLTASLLRTPLSPSIPRRSARATLVTTSPRS